ncbi:MAG: NADH-quinone oxidoreductase subunit NuoK [Pirellulales bacterium]|nr:NADH-quinone oxidoreductase subunit NuoK [Pirellulales bacterium]
MNEVSLLHGFLTIGALLFGIGLIGFLSRRNMIVMFLAVEMMIQGVSVSFVAWGRYHNNWDGQVMVIVMLAVAACEAAIAMALILMVFERSGKLDIAVHQRYREDNQPEYVDRDLPPPEDKAQVWPNLTPAGVEPEHDPEETAYRSHV